MIGLPKQERRPQPCHRKGVHEAHEFYKVGTGGIIYQCPGVKA